MSTVQDPAARVAELRSELARLEREQQPSNPALTVAFLGLLLLQSLHEVEHVVQVIQRYALRIPDGNGVLGTFFDVEPLHFAYNIAYFWMILVVHRTARTDQPDQWRRGMTAGGCWSSRCCCRLPRPRHVFKIVQFLDTGRNGSPGILGNAFDLVWLHFTFNTITLLPLIAAFFLGGFHRNLGGAARGWADLVPGRWQRPAADAPLVSRRGVLIGGAGVVGAAASGVALMRFKPAPIAVPAFVDVTAKAGIAFRHQALARPTRSRPGSRSSTSTAMGDRTSS